MDQSEIPATLFHYCSLESFFSIILEKTFHLHDVFESNDSMEQKWLDKFLGDAFDAIDDPGDNFKFFKNSVLKLFVLNRNISAYFLAFSEEGDLLSQWRGYGGDATGFAIGINTAYFDLKSMIPTRNMDPEWTVGLFNVSYEEKYVLKKATQTISNCWERFKKEGCPVNSMVMINCMAALLDWATILKNPAFSEEREWRILYKPIVSWEDGKHKVIGKLDRMHFFVRGNRIKKFFVLPFTDQKSFCPLNEIVIGPKNATSEETLRDFLAMQGLEKCKITVSKLSYR